MRSLFHGLSRKFSAENFALNLFPSIQARSSTVFPSPISSAENVKPRAGFFNSLVRALWYGFPNLFAHGDEMPLDLQSITLDGLGEIPLPLSSQDADRIRSISTQAPFGLGAQTLVDTDVRRAWQVEAGKVSCSSQDFFSRVIQDVAKEALEKIGVDGDAIGMEAKLYKLLMYDQGGHFKFHRDSEKEDGMFATMILQLPVQGGHQGGALVVKHAGRSHTFNFEDGSESKCYVTAFFADCEHELLEVSSGTRLCLVFSLTRSNTAMVAVCPEGKQFLKAVSRTGNLLSAWLKEFETKEIEKVKPNMFAIPLAHKYSSKSLSFAGLKGHDRTVVEILRSCGQSVELHLAILTKHKSVCGSSVNVAYDLGEWVTDQDEEAELPSCEIDLDQDVVIGEQLDAGDDQAENKEAKEDSWEEPFDVEADLTQLEEEVYFGNHGGSDEYWYHVAVLVVWPRDKSVQVATSRMGASAGHLLFLKKHANSKTPEAVRDLKCVVAAYCHRGWCARMFYSLLDLCVELDVRDEVLKLLGMTHKSDHESPAILRALRAYGLEGCGIKDLVDEEMAKGNLEWVASLAIAFASVGIHDLVKLVMTETGDGTVPKARYGTAWLALTVSWRASEGGEFITKDYLKNTSPVEALTMAVKVAGSFGVAIRKEDLKVLTLEALIYLGKRSPDLEGLLETTKAAVRLQDAEMMEKISRFKDFESEEFLSMVVRDDEIMAMAATGKTMPAMKRPLENRLAYLETAPEYDFEVEATRLGPGERYHRKARAAFDEAFTEWQADQNEVPLLKTLLASFKK